MSRVSVPCIGDGAANTIGVAEEVGRKVIELRCPKAEVTTEKTTPELTKRKETEKNSPAILIRPLNHFVVDCFCLDLLF